MESDSHANAFITTLRELQGGNTVADLHRAMLDLVGQVRSVGRAGTLTLAIKVAPKAQGSQLIITDAIKVAPPTPDREITILFADDENRLTRTDPRQPKLKGLRDVRSFRTDAPVPANVDVKTGEVHE